MSESYEILRLRRMMGEGRLEEVEREVELKLKEEPSNLEIQEIKGDILVKQEKYQEAVSTYWEIYNSYKKSGKYERAIAVLYKLEDILGEDEKVMSELADLYNKVGLQASAFEILKKLMRKRIEEKKYKDIFSLLKTFVKDKETAKKIVEFAFSFGMEKEARDLLAEIADKLRSEGKMDEALELLKSAETLKPKERKDLELLRQELGIPDLGRRKLAPEGLLELASLMLSIGSKEEAVNEYYSAIYSYFRQGDVNKALEVLEKIKNIAPDDRRIPKVEEILRKSGEREISFEMVDEFIREISVKDDPASRVELIKSLILSGVYDKVLSEINRMEVPDLYKDDVDGFKIQAFAELGDYESAIEFGEKKLMEVKDPDALKKLYYYIAYSYEKLGKKEDALKFYKELHAKDPDYMDVSDRIKDLEGVPAAEVEKVEEIEEIEEVEEEQVKEDLEKLGFMEEIKELEEVTPPDVLEEIEELEEVESGKPSDFEKKMTEVGKIMEEMEEMEKAVSGVEEKKEKIPEEIEEVEEVEEVEKISEMEEVKEVEELETVEEFKPPEGEKVEEIEEAVEKVEEIKEVAQEKEIEEIERPVVEEKREVEIKEEVILEIDKKTIFI